jgi:hypothetical protein
MTRDRFELDAECWLRRFVVPISQPPFLSYDLVRIKQHEQAGLFRLTPLVAALCGA